MHHRLDRHDIARVHRELGRLLRVEPAPLHRLEGGRQLVTLRTRLRRRRFLRLARLLGQRVERRPPQQHDHGEACDEALLRPEQCHHASPFVKDKSGGRNDQAGGLESSRWPDDKGGLTIIVSGSGVADNASRMRDLLGLTDEQGQMRDLVRVIARERIAPLAARVDETETYPADQLAWLGEQGLMGLYIPETYGGTALG